MTYLSNNFLENKISIYDNLFTDDQNNHVFHFSNQRSFRKKNFDDTNLYDNIVDSKWVSEISQNEPLYSIIMPVYLNSIDIFKNKEIEIIRQHVNISNFETVDIIHKDCDHKDDDHYTIIHYANNLWNLNWHGETVFYDDSQKGIKFSSILIPGRLIIFDSRIYHSARVPSKISQFPRLTIVTKLKLLKEK